MPLDPPTRDSGWWSVSRNLFSEILYPPQLWPHVFFLFNPPFTQQVLYILSFSEKAFNVVGAEVLQQSDSKAVAGKKTGVVLCNLFVPCVCSEVTLNMEQIESPS